MLKGIISSGLKLFIYLPLFIFHSNIVLSISLGHEIKDYSDEMEEEFFQHHGDREKGSRAIDLSAIFSDGYSDIFTANHHLYLISLLSDV